MSYRWGRQSERRPQHRELRVGLGAGVGVMAGDAVTTAALAEAAPLGTAGAAAAEASTGATATEIPAAASSPRVGGTALAEGTGG